MFEFEILARDGAARRGVIRTAHGELETPGFFAVGQFYSDFAQVSDQEVADLLRESDSPQRV